MQPVNWSILKRDQFGCNNRSPAFKIFWENLEHLISEIRHDSRRLPWHLSTLALFTLCFVKDNLNRLICSAVQGVLSQAVEVSLCKMNFSPGLGYEEVNTKSQSHNY